MLNSRKIAVLFGGMIFAVTGCTSQNQRNSASSGNSIRVSDRYSFKSVRSFEMYDASMNYHSIAYVRLVSGEAFPMICRTTAEGSYPIPQSVFQEQGKQRWDIMCEPSIKKKDGTAHALMRLHLAMEDGKLVNKGREVKPIRKSRLIERSSQNLGED
jgi:hypothetical protein